MLTAIRINLQRLAGSFEAALHQEGLALIDQSIQQVRNLSLDLRPAMLDVLGLEAALRWLVDRQAARAGLTPHLDMHLGGQRFSPEVETACFRIAQQALTNIVRHARAAEVWLSLERRASDLILTIRDNGCGFDLAEAHERASHGQGFGLMVMRERATLLDGKMEIHSRPGQGTEIEVRLPVPIV